MPRNRDERLIQELQWFLYQNGRVEKPSVAAIRAHLATLSTRPPGRATIYKWLASLRGQGLIDSDLRAAKPPLQTYLLLIDLPPSAQRSGKVRTLLRRGTAEFLEENVTGPFNLLVRARVPSQIAVEDLARACIAAGARDARAMVERGV